MKAWFLFVCLYAWISCTESKDKTDNTVAKTVLLPSSLSQLDSSYLYPMLAMIGDAKIIGLSESNHYMKEPLDFRNELIKYFVKAKRIDVIALESGIIESRNLFDYVHGKKGSIDSVLYYGVSWTFDKLPQNKELIEWLRHYNMNPENKHKVKIYGFDIPGSPLNPNANRNPNTSLLEALAYLKETDTTNWKKLNNRLKPFLEYIFINISDPSVKQYTDLSKADRTELTSIINDLVLTYEKNKNKYIKQSSHENYDWAYLAAISARDLDYWLQTFPVKYKWPSEISETIFSDFFWELHHKRDQTMAKNIEWIGARHKNENLFIFGHINHIAKSPQKLVLQDSTSIQKREQLGQILSSKYSKDYVVIANYHFEINRLDSIYKGHENSFEKVLMDSNPNNHYQLLSDEDMKWMNKEWKVGSSFLNANTYMNPYQGSDILFFTPRQTEIVVE